MLRAVQMRFKSGVARGFFAFQYTGFAQHHGSGADGGEQRALVIVLHERLAQQVAVEQGLRSGHSAGQHQCLGVFHHILTEQAVHFKN